MKTLLIILLFTLAACGPTDPATKRAQCIENCSDWSCDTDKQVAVCDACLANCKGMGY